MSPLYGISWRGINPPWYLLACGIIVASLISGFSSDVVARQIKLLALGDSLTAGYGLAKPDGFTEQLQRALRAEGEEIVVINAGVSGDTSAGGHARLGWALADKPDAVILELGANDGLRGIEPEVTGSNLNAILTELDSHGIPVLLAGMLAPPNLGREYGREFEAVFTRLSKAHEVVFYPFFLDGVVGMPGLNLADGMHPNKEGVAVLVQRILPSVRELLERVSN
ncbi:MAG: arylesterase [Rhodospirillaceae bacterium]|nr:arylesterase [Rhodospirillaceae bacterium]